MRVRERILVFDTLAESIEKIAKTIVRRAELQHPIH